MYYDFLVKIPAEKGKIFERTIKGVTYINYEYDRVYKPDKKYNIPKRTTIGKKCEDDDTMMYPNPNFMKYFPDAQLPADEGRDERSSCLRIGTFMVIEKLMMESMVENIVSSIYNNDKGTGLFLDLVSYYLTTENNAGQYYPDYAYNHPLFTPGYKIYSDSTVSEFIGQISVDTRYIYLTILPIRIVRLEILNLLNTVMLRTIRDCQFLIIPLLMTVITESLSSMRIIPEVLWMYHSSSVCWIKRGLTDIRMQGLFSTVVISAVKISNIWINVVMIL